MSTKKLSNISVKDFQKFLKKQGLNKIVTSKGRCGHEKWSRQDLDRPITIQTHIDPVPEFIVKQVLRHLEMSRAKFFREFDKI
ncbi:MAG: type II toxin-antitoxin system HicA family toxin [Bacteroidales bacterium]